MAERIRPGVSIGQPYRYRGDLAWCVITYHGEGRRVIRVGRKGEARKRAAEVVGGNPLRPAVVTASVSLILETYLEYCRPRKKSSTLQNYKAHTNHWVDELGSVAITDLKEDQLFRYFTDKLNVRAYDTVRAQRDFLRSAVRYWWRREEPAVTSPEHIIMLAFEDAARVMRSTPGERPAYTGREISYLMKTAIQHEDPTIAAIFFLGANTGMRLGEIIGMEWSGVDLERGLYTPRTSVSQKGAGSLKAYRQRPILLSQRVVKMLRQLFHGGQWVFTPDGENHYDRHWVVYRIDRTRKRAWADYQVPMDKSFHSLRHFFGSSAVASGWDPQDVQKQLGHKKLSTTMDIYVHPTAKKMKWGFLDDTLIE